MSGRPKMMGRPLVYLYINLQGERKSYVIIS